MTHPLKTFREQQTPRLSQKALGDLLGVARTTVARWETGVRQVDRDLVAGVAKKTGIAPAELRPDLAEVMGVEVEQ